MRNFLIRLLGGLTQADLKREVSDAVTATLDSIDSTFLDRMVWPGRTILGSPVFEELVDLRRMTAEAIDRELAEPGLFLWEYRNGLRIGRQRTGPSPTSKMPT